jgi:hypothetical protein
LSVCHVYGHNQYILCRLRSRFGGDKLHRLRGHYGRNKE